MAGLETVPLPEFTLHPKRAMPAAIKDKKHFHLDVDAANGDTLQINSYDGQSFTIEIDEPWAGDTETGFGITCSVRIERDQLAEIHEWIGECLKSKKQP